MKIQLKSKVFTKYDDTDELKRMKDSDILAEKEKTPSTGGAETAIRAGVGGLGGAVVGTVAGGILGAKAKKKAIAKAGAAKTNLGASIYKNRATKTGFGKGAGKGALLGAAIGGTILAAGAIKKKNQEREEANFYNRRLRYAQNQARRREKADWKQNMTQRDGYSY